MQWEGGRESENVEDQRSFGKTAVAIGGGGSILLLLLYLLLGGDLGDILNPGPRNQRGDDQGAGQVAPGQQDDLRRFVAVVLADTEDVWHELFRKMGKTYREPKLVLFSGRVQSACGLASAAV